MCATAWVGLGSNRGDRRAQLDRAIALLDATPGVKIEAISSYHETPPVGGPGGQGDFLNAAAALETSLAPEALLDLLNKVEADAGRVRTVRWGERTLDLDILLQGDLVLDSPRLTIPHPLMALRRFVLAPLSEIAGAAIEPMTGQTIASLLDNLDRRPSVVALSGGDRARSAGVFEGLSRVLAQAECWCLSDFCPGVEPGRPPKGLERESTQPTFAVVLGTEPWRRPAAAPIPLYWTRSSAVEAIIAEVLDVCASTRSGR